MMSAADSRTHVVETEAGFVEWATGAVGDPLRGAVRGYTGYRENATEPVARRESPTGQVVLIVSFGDQLRTQAAAAGGGGGGPAGLHDGGGRATRHPSHHRP